MVFSQRVSDGISRFPKMLRAVSVPKTFVCEDSFSFNPNRKHHWLQKICLKILAKLGCQRIDTSEVIEYRDLQSDDLLDLIHQSINSVRGSYGSDRDELVVCVGYGEWTNLIASPQYSGLFYPVHYMTGPFFQYDGISKNISPFGVQVAVIPWMTGVVVVPRNAVADVIKA